MQKRAIYLEGVIIGQLTLNNEDGSPRWVVNIVKMDKGHYAVEDNSTYSLFSNPLVEAISPETAISTFLQHENYLINSL